MRPFPVIDADGHVIARDRELPRFFRIRRRRDNPCRLYGLSKETFRPWSVPANEELERQRRSMFL